MFFYCFRTEQLIIKSFIYIARYSRGLILQSGGTSEFWSVPYPKRCSSLGCTTFSHNDLINTSCTESAENICTEATS